MALMESSMRPVYRGPLRFDYYDKLFDQFIDPDSFSVGGEGGGAGDDSDSSGSKDWPEASPDSRSIHDHILSLKLGLEAHGDPDRLCNQSSASSRVSERIVSLADLRSIQNPSPSHPSPSLSRRKSDTTSADNPGLVLRRFSSGVQKPPHKPTALPTMSQRPQPKRQTTDKGSQKRDKSSSEAESSKSRQRPITAAPVSAPMLQTTWASSPQYEPYGHHPVGPSPGDSRQPFHSSALSSGHQSYAHTPYSSAPSPHAEHSGGEEMTGYFQSPDTPYFTEAEAMTPHHGFGSYSPLSGGQRYPTGPQSHHSGMDMGYGHEQDYAESEQEGWWGRASADQPYEPNPAYPAQNQQTGHQRALRLIPTQSEYRSGVSGLTIKRDNDAPDPNYSTSSSSQGGTYPPLGTAQTLGYGKARPEQLAEAHRRSSSPSTTTAVPIRKKSSSGGAGAQRRSRPAGPSPRREQQPPSFVNYTPEDSRKILTGVAPSGSSKTKARREKEAAEKQRKLSLAAAKAIIEAGGDLEALEREGFIIEKDDKDEQGSSS